MPMTDHSKDTIFSTPQTAVKDFTFDAAVVEVFPDMIQRSVPGYATMISTISKLTERFAQPNSHLYDLGCSLGAATLAMRRGVTVANCKIIGVDNSAAMVERCKLHLQGFRSDVAVDILHGDINDVPLQNASVVVLNFTLQFIAPEQREALLSRIYDALLPGGVLILSEKLVFTDSSVNELLIDLHHDFKRANGYSELEISQKRTAIENVLIPDTLECHLARFSRLGFQSASLWYQCFNFSSMIAIK